MKRLNGKIEFAGVQQTLETGAIITVHVYDCTKACEYARSIGKTTIFNVDSFPVCCEVDFDEKETINDSQYDLSLNIGCIIENSKREIIFMTNTSFPIIHRDKILQEIDFNVVPLY